MTIRGYRRNGQGEWEDSISTPEEDALMFALASTRGMAWGAMRLLTRELMDSCTHDLWFLWMNEPEECLVCHRSKIQIEQNLYPPRAWP